MRARHTSASMRPCALTNAILIGLFSLPVFADIGHGNSHYPGNPPQFGDSAFVALLENDGGHSIWEMSLFDMDAAWKPVAVGAGAPEQGGEIHWTITYDGLNTLTFGWGDDETGTDNSISYAVGDVDFSYLTVATGSPGNGHSPSVGNLVLQTDQGLLRGDDPDDHWHRNELYTFTSDNLAPFGAFTLTGTTAYVDQYDRNDHGGPDFVAIFGGGSAVVGEPASGVIVLTGLMYLAIRAWRRRRVAAGAPPQQAGRLHHNGVVCLRIPFQCRVAHPRFLE